VFCGFVNRQEESGFAERIEQMSALHHIDDRAFRVGDHKLHAPISVRDEELG
jgi:hypothetical protein